MGKSRQSANHCRLEYLHSIWAIKRWEGLATRPVFGTPVLHPEADHGYLNDQLILVQYKKPIVLKLWVIRLYKYKGTAVATAVPTTAYS